MCVCGYLGYQYKLHLRQEDEKAKRKAAYFAHQALLVAALEKEREEIMQQIRLEDARKEKNKKKQRVKGVGNGAPAAETAARTGVDDENPQVGAFASGATVLPAPQIALSSPISSRKVQSTPWSLSSSGGASSLSSSEATSSDSSSSYNISSLHTSEADFDDYV